LGVVCEASEANLMLMVVRLKRRCTVPLSQHLAKLSNSLKDLAWLKGVLHSEGTFPFIYLTDIKYFKEAFSSLFNDY
jgi:hypothetical protein